MTWFLIVVLNIPNAVMLPVKFASLDECKAALVMVNTADYRPFFCVTDGVESGGEDRETEPEEEEEKENA